MRSRLSRVAFMAAGILLVLCSTSSVLFALQVAQAPEVDGSSLSAGLGLVAAGVMIIRSRRRR